MQAKIIITGIVQGVGFRKFVRHHARLLGITGWVRNNPDGAVEALAIGEKKVLDELITLCERGAPLSEVDEVRVDWTEKEEGCDEFTIRHDW